MELSTESHCTSNQWWRRVTSIFVMLGPITASLLSTDDRLILLHNQPATMHSMLGLVLCFNCRRQLLQFHKIVSTTQSRSNRDATVRQPAISLNIFMSQFRIFLLSPNKSFFDYSFDEKVQTCQKGCASCAWRLAGCCREPEIVKEKKNRIGISWKEMWRQDYRLKYEVVWTF